MEQKKCKQKMSRYIYCGQCSFIRNEDIDGYGICVITKRECNCGDKCFFTERNMNDAEALKILHYAQKWRRGYKCKMPRPTLFGMAIDKAINIIRKELRNETKQGVS